MNSINPISYTSCSRKHSPVIVPIEQLPKMQDISVEDWLRGARGGLEVNYGVALVDGEENIVEVDLLEEENRNENNDQLADEERNELPRKLRERVHAINAQIERNPKKFECDVCQLKFTQAISCKRHHQRKHSETEGILCPKCLISFRTGDNLMKHMKTHMRIRKIKAKGQKYICAYCMRKFERNFNLKRYSLILFVVRTRRVFSLVRSIKNISLEKVSFETICAFCHGADSKMS